MIRHWPLLFIMVSEWLNMILQLDKLFSVFGGGGAKTNSETEQSLDSALKRQKTINPTRVTVSSTDTWMHSH